MEKWQWEVCKMFLYMAFPVGCFHYFNNPQIFEESVTKVKLAIYPPMSLDKRAEIEEMIREVNAGRELKILQELEVSQKNRNKM